MLKITHVAGTDSDPVRTLELEGELLAPWVGEVRQACAELMAGASRTRLDLAAVTFVDAAGVQLLRDLIRQGIEVAACSSFIAELLLPED
jgi:ABC-type transporter Mla MlaB component